MQKYFKFITHNSTLNANSVFYGFIQSLRSGTVTTPIPLRRDNEETPKEDIEFKMNEKTTLALFNCARVAEDRGTSFVCSLKTLLLNPYKSLTKRTEYP